MAPRATIIRVRGIGEPMGEGQMLAGVSRLMGGYPVVDLPWPAQYGAPIPFDQGVRDWIPRLHDEIRRHERSIILGYSGGAQLAGDAIAQLPPALYGRVLGVGLVSDPSTPTGQNFPNLGGIKNRRPIDGVPAVWKSDRADMMCATNNPLLRFVAKLSGPIGLGAPREINRQAFITISQVARRAIPQYLQPPNMNHMTSLAVVLDAINGVHGYLMPPQGRGDHTSYGIRKEPGTGGTYLQNLAAWARTL